MDYVMGRWAVPRTQETDGRGGVLSGYTAGQRPDGGRRWGLDWTVTGGRGRKVMMGWSPNPNSSTAMKIPITANNVGGMPKQRQCNL